MGVARGSIDGRSRPIIRVSLASGGDDFLTLVDTGFNGSLLCNRYVALSLGVVPALTSERVELADGIEHEVQHGWLSIVWLGRPRNLSVLVSANDPRHATSRDGEPVAFSVPPC